MPDYQLCKKGDQQEFTYRGFLISWAPKPMPPRMMCDWDWYHDDYEPDSSFCGVSGSVVLAKQDIDDAIECWEDDHDTTWRELDE